MVNDFPAIASLSSHRRESVCDPYPERRELENPIQAPNPRSFSELP